MARIRTVKPEIWTSEQFVECSRDARLLFIGMLNFADDRGVLKFAPRTIRGNVYPMDDDVRVEDVHRMIVELISTGLLGVYEAQGIKYIHILTFSVHQKVDRPNPKFPPPPKNPAGYLMWSTNDHRTTTDLFDDRSPPEGKGREGKGRELSIVRSSNSNDQRPDLLGKPADLPKPTEPHVDPEEQIEVDFGAWYEVYPRRVARGSALKAFRSAIRNEKTTTPQLMAATAAYATTVADKDAEFIPHPATWLNAERYLEFEQQGAVPNNDPDLVMKTKARCFFAREQTDANGQHLGWTVKPKERWNWIFNGRPGYSDCECPHAIFDLIADELKIPATDWPRSLA